MYSDQLVIEAAKSRIDFFNQEEINQKEYLNVHLTINEPVPQSLIVIFHREKINNALGWTFVDLIKN
ncbi:hypothetical protein [Pedobacter endophyticus]|uniref:Uncharacterized protein n=1 Tax=Pedobacter endophyticus TaxID=2789740 RepID=A0A7U3Q6K5_9SPHI|nr:hypothetical protein [Pedobacter endophyticus]QPH38750.1 hypothetical protein IZT61_16995 [Pedobacter endophyticus]